VSAAVVAALAAAVAFGGCAGNERGATSTHSKSQTPPPPGDSYQVLGRQEGLGGFLIKYDDRLYRGGAVLNREGAERLRKLGVKTIISAVPSHTERELAREFGITLVEVPFTKSEGISPATREEILSALKTADGPVYAHCQTGAHRGGTMCLMYRRDILGWDEEKALDEFDRLGGDREKDKRLIESSK
jgi:protein tyrosine phosphatase (PTP) superfamily phosphohydrolase (DUF442 family)